MARQSTRGVACRACRAPARRRRGRRDRRRRGRVVAGAARRPRHASGAGRGPGDRPRRALRRRPAPPVLAGGQRPLLALRRRALRRLRRRGRRRRRLPARRLPVPGAAAGRGALGRRPRDAAPPRARGWSAGRSRSSRPGRPTSRSTGSPRPASGPMTASSTRTRPPSATSAARALGAEVHLDTPVDALRGDRDGWRVASGATDAAGASTASSTPPAPGGAVAALAGAELPVVASRRDVFVTGPVAGCRCPRRWSSTRRPASGGARRASACCSAARTPRSPRASARASIGAGSRQVLEAALPRFPFLAEVGLDRRASWWGWYEVTPDHLPAIGEAPDAPGLVHAAGFSGHGVQHAPATGHAVADLLLAGGSGGFDLSPVRPRALRRLRRRHAGGGAGRMTARMAHAGPCGCCGGPRRPIPADGRRPAARLRTRRRARRGARAAAPRRDRRPDRRPTRAAARRRLPGARHRALGGLPARPARGAPGAPAPEGAQRPLQRGVRRAARAGAAPRHGPSARSDRRRPAARRLGRPPAARALAPPRGWRGPAARATAPSAGTWRRCCGGSGCG
jgi:glycine/D-amino acid oxidase-like deaminating enzyme